MVIEVPSSHIPRNMPQHPDMRSQGFGLDSSSDLGQSESENTSIVEEAKNLLTQFMRHSSHKAREPQNDDGGGSEGCVSHNISVPLEKSGPDSILPWPTTYATSENSTPERKSRKHNIMIQRSSSNELSNRPTCRPERQQVPPYRESSEESLKFIHERAAVLPRNGRKPSFSPKQSVELNLEPDQNKRRTTGTRRSGRSKSGPTNYFQSINLSDLDSEDLEYSQISPPKKTVPPRPSPDRPLRSSPKFGQLLRNRELGCNVNRKINSEVASKFKLCKKWKGASNDVVVMAWSPDGTRFAAGATAQCDEHNMEYNRGNNLLLGDLTRNSLEELPDHCIPRPDRCGTNRVMNDARLFMSVTAVQWFHDYLFTGSYDNTVKLWDFARGKASCHKTLRHDSKVQVMARSIFEHNVLATGTQGIGLWNIQESSYTPLDYRKDKELVPTSLAWGTVPSTKNWLLAGLAEKDDGISQNGLLTAWVVREGAVTPCKPLLPNSQNIFDIKWHPTSGAFVTGSTTGLRHIGSVVRHYEPLGSQRAMREFDCPALDINDVTFCPVNSNYVTASCTDGNTYVWDYRKHNEFVLKLPHGEPLNQTDETLTREQADVGVRVALWGIGIDQFYTGASDGVLKRWNILKSSEDALVEDTARLEEEIMSANFSDDKSNLLVGDAAGGIHVLSSGPFFNTDEQSFTFERARLPCEEYGSELESGVKAGRKLLSSGQLFLHPVYGVGQGPRYAGPFAAWARPEGTPNENIAQTQLRKDLQIRQLDGIPPERRSGLDEMSRRDIRAQIQLARIRNQRQSENKRKRAERSSPRPSTSDNFIDLCSDSEEPRPLLQPPGKVKRRAKAWSREPVIVYMESGVIDLTGDSDDEELADISPAHGLYRDSEHSVFDHAPKLEHERVELEEVLDEDFWWPSSHCVDPNIQDDTV